MRIFRAREGFLTGQFCSFLARTSGDSERLAIIGKHFANPGGIHEKLRVGKISRPPEKTAYLSQSNRWSTSDVRHIPLRFRQTPCLVELSDWRRWWKERGEDELRTLLIDAWDPINMKDDPFAPVDEYDSYALPLARKLREGASPDEVAAFLDAAEVQMGYGEIPRNAAVGDEIVRWYADSTGRFGDTS